MHGIGFLFIILFITNHDENGKDFALHELTYNQIPESNTREKLKKRLLNHVHTKHPVKRHSLKIYIYFFK